MIRKGLTWFIVICLVAGFAAGPASAGSGIGGAGEHDEPAKFQTAGSGDADLLVIAPQEFLGALAALKAHKDSTDIQTKIITLESIYSSYPGRDQPEKVKRAIDDYRSRFGTLYVMLVGDCDKFPVRYIRAINTEWGTMFFPSDLYYADLYDSSSGFDDWDYDNDGFFGEMDFSGFPEKNLAKLNLDRINMYPDIMVGRIPASTAAEVTTFVNKVIRYENDAYNADWSKKALWAVDFDAGYPADKERLDGYLAGFTIEKPYQDSRWTTGSADAFIRRDFRASEINRIMNEGVGFVNYFGHGGTNAWSWVYDQNIHAHDMDALTNSEMLPIVYAVACLTGRFYFDQGDSYGAYDFYRDYNNNEWRNTVKVANRPEPMATQPSQYDRESFAEEFTVKRDTGAVAYIGTTEKAEIGGDDLDKYFFEAYSVGWKPPALGYLWDSARSRWIDNYDLTANYAFIHMHKVILFGDPSLRVGGIPPVRLSDAAGTYRMDHNGWKGTLTLEADPGAYIENKPPLVGKYTGDDGMIYDAFAYVRTWQYPLPDSWGADNRIELHIDFAEHTVFEGFIWSGTKDKFAGTTSWHSIPFGFYAVKQGSAPDGSAAMAAEGGGLPEVLLGGSSREVLRQQAVAKQDFTGTYTMDHDGWKGVLTLGSVADDPIEQAPNLRGTYTGLDGRVYDAWAYVRTPTYPIPARWGPDHKIELHIAFAEESVFEGYLWTGTKDTIAGVTSWHGRPFGFYAIRALTPLPGCTFPPTDPDGDGIYEDLNGNGRLDFSDVVLFFTQMQWIAGHEPVAAFDLNGNGRIDFADIVALFNEV